MAPEALTNEFVPASDIWSLGVTVAVLHTGKLPWSKADMGLGNNAFLAKLASGTKKNSADVPEADDPANETPQPNSATDDPATKEPPKTNSADVPEKPPEPIFEEGFDDDVKEFVLRCLVVDPKDRDTIEQLLKSDLLK